MTRKSKKRTRDPARPKRAMTPFLYFACEQRQILKAAGEKLPLPQQSKRIAELWRQVTDKTKYEAQSAKDRERYTNEMSRYVPPKKIKRPRSSYAFFMQAVRNKVAQAAPDKTPRELMGDIAAAWKSISVEDKATFTTMASKDKERYAQEKATEQSI